jgi:3-methylfumaryl-CoA hydratase
MEAVAGEAMNPAHHLAAGPDVVTPALVARFAATFGLVRPAGRLPPGLHACLAPDAVPPALMGPDGLPVPAAAPVPLPEGFARTMWAGGSIAWHGVLAEGDTVERRLRVLPVEEKAARHGRLAFGGLEQDYCVGGVLRVRDTHRYVFRSADTVLAPPAEAPPCDWPVLAEHMIDEVMLFRYSALTFNAHRIHVDAPYATAAEGFPGLVVHGPLSATLLMLAAEALAGAPLARIAFRATAPAFCGERLAVHGQRDGDTLRLELRSGAKRVMTAEAGL